MITLNRRSFLLKTAVAGAAVGTLNVFAKTAAVWPKGYTLELNIVMAAASGFRYRRPYLAAWIEDASGKPVKNLALWVDASGRGVRYINHLRQWTTDNGSNTDTLISTQSSATRDPGAYTLSWDGTNDVGQPVAQGKYMLCLEVSREHGPYSSQRETLNIGSKAFAKTFKTSGDVASFNAKFAQDS